MPVPSSAQLISCVDTALIVDYSEIGRIEPVVAIDLPEQIGSDVKASFHQRLSLFENVEPLE